MDEDDEELDILGKPASKDENFFILGECTLTLVSKSKVIKCQRKKKAIADRLSVDTNCVKAFLFTLAVNKDDAKIASLLETNEIILIDLSQHNL